MWKRAVWVEGRNEEEGVVPCTWIDEEKQSLYWPQGVNAENALSSRQHPDPKLWRKFQLVKVKVSSVCKSYSSQAKLKRLIANSPKPGSPPQKLDSSSTANVAPLTFTSFKGASMTTVARGLDLAMITTGFTTLTIPRNFSMKAMTAWTDFSNRTAVTNMNDIVAIAANFSNITFMTYTDDMTT
ncbi:hypothetical protein GWK47_014567 [Chionoecetes opilio]|uniref:Uncharacterized protein n=1 Tax=Chionoecetes opilio TaxID=41210 RepID=A0A8J4XY45_CHIOP|nr:hypothetical protein GWK47_014567 [Chionoecetes opilio]